MADNYDTSLKTGGIPLSVTRITSPLVDTFGEINSTYVINVIIKNTISPITNTFNSESTFYFNGNKFYFQQDSDGKSYLDIGQVPRLSGFSTEVQPPVKGWVLDGVISKEINLFGYPLAMDANNYIVLSDSGLTVGDIEEYTTTLWGGQPLTVGRISNTYYLVIITSNVS